MKNEIKLLNNAHIEIVSDKGTINNEIEVRINTRRKINRSIDNFETANNYDVFEDFTLVTLTKMQVENNLYLSDLLKLKIDLSPFKNILPIISEKYELGAIVFSSWGYEQTNIDFYCIVKRSALNITLLPMSKITSPEIEFMTNDETPGKIDFTKDPIRRKVCVNRDGEEIGFYVSGYCKLYNGNSKRSSHYA